MSPKRHLLLATCSVGIEALLADELRELGCQSVEERRGAVAWRGTLESAYRTLLESRLASRVLLEVGFGKATSERVLYDTVSAIDWSAHASPEHSLAVDFLGLNPGIRHTGFGAQRVKDAICDRLRQDQGRRPDVDRASPDLRIHAFLTEKHIAISIDLAGPPLHQRSGGAEGGQAPLKETLAAAILRLAGWHRRPRPLLDPMCGTGTLLREAAAMARGDAAGLLRTRWGFQGWVGHQPALWEGLVQQARERAPRPVPPIFGRDRDPASLAQARQSLARLGLADCVQLEQGELAQARPPVEGPGMVLCNPPYGERLGDEAEARRTMGELGDVLRRHFLGWEAWILAGSPALARGLGLRPEQRIPIWNGPIECRLLQVPIDTRPVKDEAGPHREPPAPR